MPTLSLSDLPLEILDNILRQMKQLSAEDHNFRRFHPLLLSDKRTSSRTAVHVYHTPWKFGLGSKSAQQLLLTLVSSALGKTSCPYHLYLDELKLKGPGYITRNTAELQTLMDKVLQHGRLRELALAFPQHLGLLETFANNKT